MTLITSNQTNISTNSYPSTGIGEIVENNYLEYGKYVNWHRAIPAIDGLKPVYRRIFIAAKDVARNNFTKTAKVSGEVIGNWHPHGSACLSGDTKICNTLFEIFKIKDLVGINTPMTVFCRDEKGQIKYGIAHSFRVGQITDTEYNIFLSNGSIIKCTGNHPINTMFNTWILAEELSVGTLLFFKNINKKNLNNFIKIKKYFIDDTYKYNSVSIEMIEIIKHKNPVTYYDFTVDFYQNMLIPVDINDDFLQFVCVHNSVDPVISSMVRVGLLEGQGNHGTATVEEAAPRYTEIKYKNDLHDLLFKLVDYAPHFENELGNSEPEYLITPIPISLIIGNFGIGIGVTTRIPAFTFKSLVNAYKNNDPTLLESFYGYKIISAEWDSLWNKGFGSIKYRYLVDNFYSKEDCQDVISISGYDGIFQPKLAELDKYTISQHLYKRDESGDNLRLIYGRTKGTRLISNEDIYKMAIKASTIIKAYNIKVNIFGKIKTIGIKDWLDTTFSLYNSTLSKWKTDKIIDLNHKLKIYKIIPKVVSLLNKNKTNDEIISILVIDQLSLSQILSKPISILRKTAFDNEIQSINEKISLINNISIDNIINSVNINCP